MKIEGQLNASGLNIAVVTGRFNDFITSKLLEGAKDCFNRHGMDNELTEVWVPGAFEIPLAAKKLAEANKFDAILCLGAIIRGSTAHFDHVAKLVQKGLLKLTHNLIFHASLVFLQLILSSKLLSVRELRPEIRAGRLLLRRLRWRT
jgi:6,7-dimethyl-8-ribityllumazine synthase